MMLQRQSIGLLAANATLFWACRPLAACPASIARYASQYAPTAQQKEQQQAARSRQPLPVSKAGNGAPSSSSTPSSKSQPPPPQPSSSQSPAPAVPSPTDPSHPLSSAPRAYGARVDDFTPIPLTRPIGLPDPPQPGENSGVDTRSGRQRRADLVNYEKHLARRRVLRAQFARPYFREWSNLRFHRGKTFVAPPRPFRADRALFFPNLVGWTLAGGSRAGTQDTTPVLAGRVSVVAVFSSAWAEAQVQSFVAPEANPALHEALRQAASAGDKEDRAQLVQVNVEENALRAWLIRLFSGSLRRRVGPANAHRYFVVRRGLTDDIREAMGLLNSKVGYVYLVDAECRIRWAGSGPSEPEERQSLVSGLQRLLRETDGQTPLVREKKNEGGTGSAEHSTP